MKRTVSIFSYPVVLKESGGELMWVCPDFNIYTAVALPAGKKIGVGAAARIAKGWLDIMRLLYKEIDRKVAAGKHLPKPSSTPDLFDVNRNHKLYSPEEAVEIVGASVNSIRRALDAGVVGCSLSHGGHRRMSESQVLMLRDYFILGPKDRRNFVTRDLKGIENGVERSDPGIVNLSHFQL